MYCVVIIVEQTIKFMKSSCMTISQDFFTLPNILKEDVKVLKTNKWKNRVCDEEFE